MQYVIGGLTRFAENPSSFKVTDYGADEKNMILSYMKNGRLSGVGGYVDDLRTGEPYYVTNSFYEDDVFMWSTQDIYHIEKYNAAVKPEFVEHIRNKLQQAKKAS